MQHRSLGRSGLQVSLVGLGCNNFGGRMDLERTRGVIDKAIALGITSFDTADVYGGAGKSEEFIGAALGDRRKQVVLATKFGKMSDAVPGTRGTRAYIRKGGGGEPQAAQDRLDRPLLHARARSADPHRGDARRPR